MSLEETLLRSCSQANPNRTKVITLLQRGANPNSDEAKDKSTGATPLHYACQYGWTEVARLLVNSHQCKPDVRDNAERTPLHYAARYGDTNTIVFLCMFCGGPNVTDKNGDTPLHLACQAGSFNSAECLLEPWLEKCDPNCKNNSGLTPLQVVKRSTHSASSSNYDDIICELIQHGAYCSSLDLSVFDNEGNTVLHRACKLCNLNNVKCLLQTEQCDPNHKNQLGVTPLQITPVEDSYVIRELLQHGANPNSVDVNGDTVLHKACRAGVIDSVKCLLADEKCDPNHKNRSGMTPLHVSTRGNHVLIVDELLQHGAIVNVVDKDGNTPLHIACELGMLEAVIYLLQAPNCDLNLVNNKGLTPLLLVKPNGTLIVKELIKHGANFIIENSDGNTILHLACHAGNRDIVKCLLEANKLDLNCKNKSGKTPLHLTLLQNDYNILNDLLEHGADPNISDTFGDTPLHDACRLEWLKKAQCLLQAPNCDPNLENQCGITPLQITPVRHSSIISELLQHGANPNSVDVDGDTVLHKACRAGVIDSVKCLLADEKCDPNHKNRFGMTPLHVTTRENHFQIVDELLQCGAIVNVVDKYGDTPLHIACELGMLEAVIYLLQAPNCDLNLVNNKGLTPLLLVKPNGTLIVKELIKHGANPNVSNSDGNTMLHLACRAGNRDIIKCFLKAKKIYLNRKNKSGKTPLHLALLHNDHNILGDLLEHGANPNVPNRVGDTPLHDACRLGWLREVQCLLQATNCDPNVKNHKSLTPLLVTPPKCSNVIKKLVQHGANVNAVDSSGNTLLHKACQAGEMESVKILLEAQCDPNCKNVEGLTPVDMTSIEDADILLELIQYGANPNIIVDSDGNTLLHKACKLGRLIVVQHLLPLVNCESRNNAGLTPLQLTPLTYKCNKIVQELIEYGADPNVVDSDGNSLLHNACSGGSLARVQCLLCTAKCDINSKNKDGLTPLQVADTSPQFTDIIRELIQHGADPNVVDSDGNTPLHHYCSMGSLASASYLLNGTIFVCDVNCRNNSGITPLQVTPSKCYELASKLLEHVTKQSVNDDGDTALHIACREGMVDVIKNNLEQFSHDLNSKNKAGQTPIQVVPPIYASIIWELVQKGANPNVINVLDGDTPLHKACFEEKLVHVEYLLKIAKCDPNIKNRDGLTPLQVTASWNTSIVVALIAHGADPNVVDRNGDTPLHKACRDKCLDTVRSLGILVNNFDPNIKNNVGKTPIQLTPLWNNNIIKVLLEHGADPNTTDNDGNTLLHNACRAGTLNSVKCILSAPNCDPNAKNSAGLTPLQVTFPEHSKVFRKLIQHGANPKVVDNKGDTLLHYACSYGKLDTVQLLLKKANCDPNVRNDSGLAPLSLTDVKSTEIIQSLIDHGAQPDSTDNDGNTILHKACISGSVNTVKYLSEVAKCNLKLKNKAGLTPLQVTPPEFIDVIRELVRHGANPQDVYKTFGRSLKSPLQSPIKVFVVGDSGVGKSTLTAALQKESTFLTRTFLPARKITEVDQKTAGVIPYDFQSKEYGYATIYDFAGHREFYGSHAALMENAIQHSPPIIVLVVDLTENEAKINLRVLYWFTFLENQCITVTSKPHIIIVGSHADVLEINGEVPEAKARAIKSRIPPSDFVFVRFITMDCQYSDSPGISELRQCLKTSCNALRTNTTINFNSHCFYVYLLDAFKGIAALTVKEIQQRTETTQVTSSLQPNDVMSFIPSSLHVLIQICEELNDRGHILFLKDSENIENSWVVIDKVALLSQVTGTIFAPEGFRQHSILTQCKCSTGVVPFSNIKSKFPNHDPKMLVGFLSCLEICHEISDEEILLLITSEHQTCVVNRPLAGSQDRYFLFPALVTLNVPNTVWEPNESQFTYHSGWMLQCSNELSEQFFTSRFLQVLLLRLAFCFPLLTNEQGVIPAFHKICSIWKNGLFWGNKHGVETLVEVISDNKTVVLLMRCDESSLIELLKLRSKVITKILRAAEEFCGKLDTIESFIDPSKIKQYPLKAISQLKLFSLRNVCHSAIEAKPSSVLCTTGTIPFEKLILFEPYAGLGVNALSELFSDTYQTEHSDKVISDSFLMLVAQKCTSKPELIVKMFDPTSEHCDVPTVHKIFSVLKHWRDTSKGTYQNLREVFDQFSIFSGRNPLALVGIPIEQLRSEQTTPAEETHKKKLPLKKESGNEESSSSNTDSQQAIPSKGDKPTLKHLQVLKGRGGRQIRVIDSVAYEWEELAIALELEEHDIDHIRSDFSESVKGACRTVLRKWLNGESGSNQPITWTTLI